MGALFNKRLLALSLFLSCAVLVLHAQSKRPAWVQKTPSSRNSYIGIATTEKVVNVDSLSCTDSLNVIDYKNIAYREAMQKVTAQLPWEKQQQLSLYSLLSQNGLYHDSLENVLLDKVMNSNYFRLVDEWESDSEYWCYVSVKEQDADIFLEQMITDARNSAERLFANAQQLQAEGHLYRAAMKYIEALDSLHPAISQFLPVQCGEKYVDLGRLIYDRYINVYQGIEITTNVEVIPGVYNEEVPGVYSVQITQDGKPLPKIGVIAQFEGDITMSPTTDNEGKCNFSIDRITSNSEYQTLTFAIDAEYLLDLPPVYGCYALRDHRVFPSLDILVRRVEPRTLVKVNTNETDSLLKSSIENVLETYRTDILLTENADSADVVIDTYLNIVKAKDIVAGKYQFVEFIGALDVIVRGVADDILLTEYTIKDFKVLLPANRTDAQYRQSILREMNRQLNREFPSLAVEYKFDKREIIWRPLRALSE